MHLTIKGGTRALWLSLLRFPCCLLCVCAFSFCSLFDLMNTFGFCVLRCSPVSTRLVRALFFVCLLQLGLQAWQACTQSSRCWCLQLQRGLKLVYIRRGWDFEVGNVLSDMHADSDSDLCKAVVRLGDLPIYSEEGQETFYGSPYFARLIVLSSLCCHSKRVGRMLVSTQLV